MNSRKPSHDSLRLFRLFRTGSAPGGSVCFPMRWSTSGADFLIEAVEILLYVEGVQPAVLTEVQGVVGVALFRPLPGGVPGRPMGLADGNHVPDTGGQIVPLFDDGAPGRPDGGLSVLVEGQNIVKGLHVLLVERLIAVLFHVIRVGGPLGVDVEHDKAVKAVVEGHPLHRLQGVVLRGRLPRVARMYRYSQ